MKNVMQILVLLLIFAAVGIVQAGGIDDDGYYVFDLGQLQAFEGATGENVTLHVNDNIISTSNWPNSTNNWYTVIWRNNGDLFPANFGDAVGLKMTLSNVTGADIAVGFMMQTDSNSWVQGANPNIPADGTPTTISLDFPVVGEGVYNIGLLIVSWDTTTEKTLKVLNLLEDPGVPHNPAPANDTSRWVDAEQVLSWNTALDPATGRPFLNIRKHYLFGSFNNASPTDPNLYYIDEVDAPTVSGTDPNILETAQYPETGTLSLDLDRIYYWQIVEGIEDPNNPGTIFGPTDPNNTIISPIWKFLTRPPYTPPTLEFPNVITTLDLANPGPVNISANIVDNTDSITTAEITLLTDAVDFPAGADYTFTDTTTDNENPTATLVTDTVGTYIVKASVSDGTTAIEALAEVVVLADACEAQKDPRSSAWQQNYYDRDGDCDVDIADFSVFALEWLDDSSMQAQESYSGGVSYLPQSVFDARVEAESVDPQAVSDAPLTDDVGIRIVDEAGASGNGQALGWTNIGDYAEFEITVDAAVYDVWTSTASPSAGASTVLDFGDDTTTDLYGSVGPFTGTTWGEYHVDEFIGALDFTTVGAGTYTIRISWPNGSVNFDWFTLVKQP